MSWTSDEWDTFVHLLASAWHGHLDDETAAAWRLLLDGLALEEAVATLRRLLADGRPHRPSVSEFLAAARADPGRPTFAEAYQLIFGPRGILRARPAGRQAFADAGEQRRAETEAAVARAAELHPLVGGFVRSQGLPLLRRLPIDDPEWGHKHRGDLERAWGAFVAAHDGREVAALAAGTGREGLRQLDPLAGLDPPQVRELPEGNEGESGG